jgi:hypothetical protein
MNRFDRVFDSAVGSTMRPGAPGTGKFVRDWGERLVAVRYRYSDSPPTRFTTIEVVVGAASWKVSANRQVLVEVKSWEPELREKVKEAGAKWLPKAMRWRMRHDRAKALGIAPDRVSYLAPRTRKTSTDTGIRKSLPVGISAISRRENR